MNDPKISIIVPVYNTEKYLQQCLQSLLDQTYSNLEIIVVNDGSTDNSENIITDFAMKDCRIREIKQKNSGLSAARNKGLENAEGDYVIFVDSDDWIDQMTCEEAIITACQYNAEVVMWSYKREYPDCTKTTLLFGDEKIIWNEQNIHELYQRLIGLVGKQLSEPQKIDSIVTAWGKLYKRESLNNVRFTDTKEIGTEDALFNIQAFVNFKTAVYIPESFSHYRKDNMESLTHSYKKELPDQWEKLYLLIKKHLDAMNAPALYYEALSNRICLGLIGLGLNLAEDNTMGFKEKKQELNILLHMSHYQKALDALTLEHMPLKWKYFFACAKKKWTFNLYILLYIMNFLRGKS